MAHVSHTPSAAPISDTPMDWYGFAKTGELGSKGGLTCWIVVVILTDNSVLVEHRSNILFDGNPTSEEQFDNESMKMFRDVIKHMRDCNGDPFKIR
jgi:hypothetical protein